MKIPVIKPRGIVELLAWKVFGRVMHHFIIRIILMAHEKNIIDAHGLHFIAETSGRSLKREGYIEQEGEV